MNKKKILLIDDEIIFTNLVKMNIEQAGGYEVKVENNGSRGLDAALEFMPDLILLDIIMPEMEGSLVAEQIKANEELKNIPIVFLTATVLKEEIPANGKIGGALFISKPVKTEELLGVIAKILG